VIANPKVLADIQHAEREFECYLSPVVIIMLRDEISGQYRSGLDFENLLDAAVNNKTNDNDERHGYKQIIGKIFFRRQQWKASALSQGR